MTSKVIIRLFPLPGDDIKEALYAAWQHLLYYEPDTGHDEAEFEFNGHIVTVMVKKL